MGNIGASTFGIGTPTTLPGSAPSWGLSPYAGQFAYPFSNQSISGYGVGAALPVPQILQLLQILPQQLQQLQVLQQQQLVHLQQLLQLVPQQLQQLQQLIQIVPQQVQHLPQQWQPYGSTFSSPAGFGLQPQPFIGQAAGYVM